MVFAKVIIEAYDAGFIVSNASHPSNWDFASAVHFSMTVITTVGKETVMKLYISLSILSVFNVALNWYCNSMLNGKTGNH